MMLQLLSAEKTKHVETNETHGPDNLGTSRRPAGVRMYRKHVDRAHLYVASAVRSLKDHLEIISWWH